MSMRAISPVVATATSRRGVPTIAARGVLKCLLGLTLLASAWIPIGFASTAEAASMQTYRVEVTGIHDIAWNDQGVDYPKPCSAWSHGSGTRTLGLRTTRAMTYRLLQVPRHRPVLLPSKPGRLVGTARQRGSWNDHVMPITTECTPCGPLSEYGPCQEDPNLLAPVWRCGTKKKIATYATLEATQSRRGGIDVTWRATVAFPGCPPTHRDGPGIYADRPLPTHVSQHDLKRVAKLRRGRKLKLRAALSQSYSGTSDAVGKRCSTPPTGVGYRECAITHITIEIKRTG